MHKRNSFFRYLFRILSFHVRSVRGAVSSQAEFSDWMRENSQTLMKAARAIAWHDVNADDIFQEALADVYSKWKKLKNHPNLVAYTIVAMRNRHLDMRKKWERKRDENESEMNNMTNILISTIDQSDDVSDRLLVQAALAALSPMQRVVLLMNVVEGFMIREIAEYLEIPQGTAASHLNRGKMAVSAFLEASNQIESFARNSIPQHADDKVVDAEVIEE